MKKALLVMLLLSVAVAGQLFAEDVDFTFDTDFNAPGQINANVTVGWGGGLAAAAGAEYIVGIIDIEDFPLEWGVAARAVMDFGFFSGFDFGVGGLGTLHKGFSLGEGLDFDFNIGLGLGYYTTSGFPVGFAHIEQLAWLMNENMWVFLENTSVGSAYCSGIGVRFAL